MKKGITESIFQSLGSFMRLRNMKINDVPSKLFFSFPNKMSFLILTFSGKTKNI